MNINEVLICGRLTGDPQLRSTKSGSAVAVFSIATNRTWNDKNNQKQEEVEYHNVVVWGRQAEIVSKFLVKGQIAFVQGRLATREYEDKQGQKRRVTEIVAERVQFGPKAGGGASAPSGQAPSFRPQSSNSTGASMNQTAAVIEEIPTINIDEEIKAEDLPF